MNSDKNKSKKLPEGWVLCTSKSNPGRKYYFNKKTGKSSWTEPQVCFVIYNLFNFLRTCLSLKKFVVFMQLYRCVTIKSLKEVN